MNEPESVKNTGTVSDKEKVSAKERKPTSKKKRVTMIIALCLVAALALSGGITAAVLLTREDTSGGMRTPTALKQYSYFIAPSDTEGFVLDDSFRAEVPLGDIERRDVFTADGVVLTEDLRLYSTPAAQTQSYAIYEFYYKNAKIAIVNVTVAAIDAEIKDVNGLMSMESGKSYALGADIDMSGVTEGIASFDGDLYGNHHEIKGLGIAGGLFKELYAANVVGIEFTEVNVNVSGVSAGSYGVIAGTTNYSDISYCTVSGSYTLSAELNKNEILYVGGLAGYAYSLPRKNEAFDNLRKISNCVSYLTLTVSATGDVKIGGIAGGIVNASLRECYAYGATSFKGTDASRINGVYLGGLAGVLVKEYALINDFDALDEGAKLYSYSALKAEIAGDNSGITTFFGGLFGSVENHSLVNVGFGGSLDVKAGKTASFTGGIAASASNTTALAMRLRGVNVSASAIGVYSIYNAYAGGLAGRFAGIVTYEKVTASVMPVITTDSSSNTGLHVASESVARVVES